VKLQMCFLIEQKYAKIIKAAADNDGRSYSNWIAHQLEKALRAAGYLDNE
jgi:hypothetical protein